ncbi:MAG: undecaprenyl/decaprenyl-phosphate alpha-N-acetylglucosaminyl 1-phosphate transferase [Sedimentisphaerales bacterium]|nr:undecaprenyl/decaprenyl-phosphate alpha-N-acetylglucosaminyl 1-phosphate transferase [Sedimentisphaerales bacterium]
MKTYLFTACLALLLSIGLTPLVIALARARNWIDRPNARSVHCRPIPRLGGIALFAATMLTLLPVLFLQNNIGDAFRGQGPQILAILAGGSLMFLVGLADDLRTIRIRTKLAAQLVAAVGVCLSGVYIDTLTIPGLFRLDMGLWGFLITVFWLVGVTNAVNLTDGLDGLAAGIGAIACGFIAVMAVQAGNVILAVIMLALFGSLAGFLCFNFNPARIFMGDCGSLFLGFMIAAASVLTAAMTETLVGVAIPILVLGIPIFDTFFCMLRRFLQRRGIMSADRGHFHHRLLDMGFSQHHVAIITYAITLVISGLGCFLLVTQSAASLIIFLCCLILLLLIFRCVGAVRLDETIAGIQRRSEIAQRQRIERKDFEESQLHFRNARSFDEWWIAVCFTAQKLQFHRLALDLTNRDGSPRRLLWEYSGGGSDMQAVELKLPIPDRRHASFIHMEVRVPQNGSLESVGRRVTFLARLIEEHGLHTLSPNIPIHESRPEQDIEIP